MAITRKPLEIQISNGDEIISLHGAHITSIELGLGIEEMTKPGDMYRSFLPEPGMYKFSISGVVTGDIAAGLDNVMMNNPDPKPSDRDKFCVACDSTYHDSLFHPGTCINCGCPRGRGK